MLNTIQKLKSKEKSIEKSNITFKNEKSNNGLKVKMMVEQVFLFVIAVRQDEFDTYRTIFY